MNFRTTKQGLSLRFFYLTILLLQGGGDVKAQDYTRWRELVNFRPPERLQRLLSQRGHPTNWYVQRIEDGAGERVNLDYFPVRVKRLPSFHRTSADPQDLLDQMRLAFESDALLDPNLAKFSLYEERMRTGWESRRSDSVVVGSFSIKDTFFKTFRIPAERASVVLSDQKKNSWTFSTIWTTQDGLHPVSGNRRWGYYKEAGGSYIFYTKGADRISSGSVVADVGLDRPLNDIGMGTGPQFLRYEDDVFQGGEALWVEFQKRLVRFIRDRGGQAELLAPGSPGLSAGKSYYSQRHLWKDVQQNLFQPQANPTKWYSPPIPKGTKLEVRKSLWTASTLQQLHQFGAEDQAVLVAYVNQVYVRNANADPEKVLNDFSRARKRLKESTPKEYLKQFKDVQTQHIRMNRMMWVLGSLRQSKSGTASLVAREAIGKGQRLGSAASSAEERLLSANKAFSSLADTEGYLRTELEKSFTLATKNPKARKVLDRLLATPQRVDGVDGRLVSLAFKTTTPLSQIVHGNLNGVTLGNAPFMRDLSRLLLPEQRLRDSDIIFKPNVTVDTFKDLADDNFKRIRERITGEGGALESLGLLNEKQREILTFISQDGEQLRNQARVIVEAFRDGGQGFSVETASAGVYLFSSFVGLADKKLGRTIAIAGDAAIKIYTAVSSYLQAASQLGTLASGFGSAMLTGNIVGAALGLFSAFSGGGPTADQMILDQLGKVREDIQRLGEQMHERFDRIDHTLNQMFERMNEGFARIESQLGVLNDKVDGIRTTLFELQIGLNRMERNMYVFLNAQERRQLREALNLFTNRQDRRGKEPLTAAEFRLYEAKFYTWATEHTQDELAVPTSERSFEEHEIGEELSRYSLDANASYLLSLIDRNIVTAPLQRHHASRVVVGRIPTDEEASTDKSPEAVSIRALSGLAYGVHLPSATLLFKPVGYQRRYVVSVEYTRPGTEAIQSASTLITVPARSLMKDLSGKGEGLTRVELKRVLRSDGTPLLPVDATIALETTAGTTSGEPRLTLDPQLSFLEYSLDYHTARLKLSAAPYERKISVSYSYTAPTAPEPSDTGLMQLSIPPGAEYVYLKQQDPVGGIAAPSGYKALPSGAEIVRGSDQIFLQGRQVSNGRLPNSRDWAMAAEGYSSLGVTWPKFLRATPKENLEKVITTGQRLRTSLDNLTSHSEDNGKRQVANRLLLDQLIANYRSKLRRAREVLEQNEMNLKTRYIGQWQGPRELTHSALPRDKQPKLVGVQVQYHAFTSKSDDNTVMLRIVKGDDTTLATIGPVGDGVDWNGLTTSPDNLDDWGVAPLSEPIPLSEISQLRAVVVLGGDQDDWRFSYRLLGFFDDGSRRPIGHGGPFNASEDAPRHEGPLSIATPTIKLPLPDITDLVVGQALGFGAFEIGYTDAYYADFQASTSSSQEQGAEIIWRDYSGRLRLSVYARLGGQSVLGQDNATLTASERRRFYSYGNRWELTGSIFEGVQSWGKVGRLRNEEDLDKELLNNWESQGALQQQFAQLFAPSLQSGSDLSLKINGAFQVALAQEVLKDLRNDTELSRALKSLAGAYAMLENYAALGLPQTLRSDDVLRSLLYGSQGLPSDKSFVAEINRIVREAGAGGPPTRTRLVDYLNESEQSPAINAFTRRMHETLTRIENWEVVDGQRTLLDALEHLDILRRLHEEREIPQSQRVSSRRVAASRPAARRITTQRRLWRSRRTRSNRTRVRYQSTRYQYR